MVFSKNFHYFFMLFSVALSLILLGLSFLFHSRLIALLDLRFLFLKDFYFYFFLTVILICFNTSFLYIFRFKENRENQKEIDRRVEIKKSHINLRDKEEWVFQLKNSHLLKESLDHISYILKSLKGEFVYLIDLDKNTTLRDETRGKVKAYFKQSEEHLKKLEIVYLKNQKEFKQIDLEELFQSFCRKNKNKWESFHLEIKKEALWPFQFHLQKDLILKALEILFDFFIIYQKEKNPQVEVIFEDQKLTFHFLSLKEFEEKTKEHLEVILSHTNVLLEIQRDDFISVSFVFKDQRDLS